MAGRLIRRRRVARLIDWFCALISTPSIEWWATVTDSDLDAMIEHADR